MPFESRNHNTPLMERNDPELARHYHRAEELIEKWAPHLVPETEGEEPLWVRRCQNLAVQLRDAEYDRFVEWSAKQ